MKRKIIASLLVLAMAGSLLAGCGNKASDSGSSDSSKSSKSSASELKGDSSEKYYMCVPISGVEYWYPVFQGMKEAANALGVQAYYMGTPEWDSSAQADVFNQIMALDPTGILLHPTDGDAFVDPINSAIADDVQVVTFAADSPDSNRTAYVTSDNNKEGSTAAKEVAEEIGGKGSILVMRNPGQTNHETRDDAFISYINENYPDIKIYEENSGQNADATYTAVMTTYQKDANLKAVFTPEASSAVGAAQAGLEIGNGDQALARDKITELNTKAEGPKQVVGRLSGGNQQKVLLGKLLAKVPKVILLDEPTRGVDIGAKSEIGKYIRKLADEGIGVILISSEMNELLGLCDRLIMIDIDGDQVPEVTGERQFDSDTVVYYISGAYKYDNKEAQ